MRPAQLKPFDVLLYRNSGWLGNLISWGEWNGTKNEALEYSHIAVVYDPAAGKGFEMNPPSAHFIDLDKQPWDRIDVGRIAVDGQDVFDDVVAVDAARAQAHAMLGMRYDYGFIGKSLFVSVLARVGLRGWASQVMARKDSNARRAVCSSTAQEICEAGLSVDYLGMHLEPEGIGEGMMRPSDWPRSPLLTIVKA